MMTSMGHVAVEQIDAVQLALVAGGDGDALGRDLLVLDEILLHRVHVGGPVAVLGLDQQQRTDVVRLPADQLSQASAGEQRVAHRVLPARRVLDQHDGQLDQRLGLELRRGDAVEDVAAGAGIGVGGGGQLDDARRRHALEHVEGEAGARVVRLVHDDQRPVDHQQVGEGVFDLAGVRAVAEPLQVGSVGVQPGEVAFQRLFVRVDVAALGLFDAQGLDGAHDDADAVGQVGRPEVVDVGDVEDGHVALERVIERLAVGVGRCF